MPATKNRKRPPTVVKCCKQSYLRDAIRKQLGLPKTELLRNLRLVGTTLGLVMAPLQQSSVLGQTRRHHPNVFSPLAKRCPRAFRPRRNCVNPPTPQRPPKTTQANALGGTQQSPEATAGIPNGPGQPKSGEGEWGNGHCGGARWVGVDLGRWRGVDGRGWAGGWVVCRNAKPVAGPHHETQQQLWRASGFY